MILRRCDLQKVFNPTSEEFEAVTVKAQRFPRPEETLNVDLPVFFMFHMEFEDWYFIKGPTSKLYYEEYYMAIEKKIETSPMVKNVIFWYDFSEEACKDPEGAEHKLRQLISLELAALGEDIHSAQG